MKNIVIIPNPNKDEKLAVTREVIIRISSFGANIFVEEKYKSFIKDSVSYYTDFPTSADLIIVVGGDGSILDASTVAIKHNLPIVGVNLGKVGYLSEIEPDNLEILAKIFNEEYEIEEKMLLAVSTKSGNDTHASTRLAVNDIIVTHDSFLGIAEFSIETAGAGCVRYRADGMIFSTPAGSTAYSLSAGGPIVSHNINAVVATPICPHSFFNRSIIFDSTKVIKLCNTGTTPLNISVDGRYFCELPSSFECTVETSDTKMKMLVFEKNNMFSTLFKKMRIMEDVK